MKVNNTSIVFYSLRVRDDGTVEKVKTGEIPNKPVRGKHKAEYERRLESNNWEGK